MSPRWKPNVTVAAVIASPFAGDSRYLLVEEHTPEGVMLNNPAGHLEPHESPQQGVVREALEETARVFEPLHLLGIYLARFQRVARAASAQDGRVADAALIDDVTYLRFAYAGTVGEADPQRRLDDGIVRTVWMSLDEVRASRARHRSALVLRCIEDHAAGRRFPLDLVFADASLVDPETKIAR